MNCEIEIYNALNLDDAFHTTVQQPSSCPFCKKSIIPEPIIAVFHQRPINTVANAFFLCPNCENIFIGVYYSEYAARSTNVFRLSFCLPEKSYVSDFSENIVKLSPQFVKIYQQSQKAESAGLNEICGMGYRKALEFLIKDFAIYRNPDNKDRISKQLLSPCITETIDNSRIKTLATASAWLGNDEAHYLRKHEDYDIEHLKAFIQALVSFIDSDLEVDKATSLLEKK